ncbi:hypothetical protein PP836_004754 [Salmonella enterica]|nr:hypothetical protein [Salmonella enterica]EKL0444645.1 hypothetical protein [Salmonella enterica]
MGRPSPRHGAAVRGRTQKFLTPAAKSFVAGTSPPGRLKRDVVTSAPGKSAAGNRPQRWRQEGKSLTPAGARGAPSPARQWRRDRSGRCKPGFQTSDRSEARNRASGFGGAWRVRQQLPGGVGLDDRMTPVSREPKVSMRSWPTEQQTPHSKNSPHTMNGRKGCAAGAACLHFRQASACQGFSAA